MGSVQETTGSNDMTPPTRPSLNLAPSSPTMLPQAIRSRRTRLHTRPRPAKASFIRSLRHSHTKSRNTSTDNISNRENNHTPNTRPINSSNSSNNISSTSSNPHPNSNSSSNTSHQTSECSSSSGDRNRSSSYRLRLLDSNVPAARILF